jgi:hypothetical protein
MDIVWTTAALPVLKDNPIALGAIVAAISTIIGIISTTITVLRFILCYALFIFLFFFIGVNLLAGFRRFSLVPWLTDLLARSEGCEAYPLNDQ